MKNYFMYIISAAVLSGIFERIAPDTWKKYLNIVTGIMMISIILSPVPYIRDVELFKEPELINTYNESIRDETIRNVLSGKISDDASERIYHETGIKAEIETSISVDKDGNIIGIEEIKVWTAKKETEIESLLNKVYKPLKITFNQG